MLQQIGTGMPLRVVSSEVGDAQTQRAGPRPARRNVEDALLTDSSER